jgi:hemoglobin
MRGMSPCTVRRDIGGREDVAGLVTEFYRRVFADELLGPVFVDVAHVDLSAHLPVMCDFWETVLLHTGRYRRNALRPHLALATRIELTPAHFTRWLALWTAIVDERHAGERAEVAKVQATRIAGSISARLLGRQAAERVTVRPQPPERRPT